MPIQACEKDGKAGYRWGKSGACYTHDGSDDGRNAAKKKAIKQAIAAGATSRELADDPEVSAELLRELEAELPTVDLDGVEILAVGGPIRGRGSPPEGDYWTTDDLRAMADADAELEGELNPPARIGHGGDQPAVGYLENLRLNDDGTRLLADVKRVPKKLAKLIKAGAYRARSVELSKLTSQKTGKTYEWVVTGMAWLGSKLPAVRTLDDVVALYDGGELEVRLVVEYAEGEIVWEPDEGLEALRAAVQAALNPGPGEMRYWVRDVAPGKALIEDYRQEGKAWIVPFTRGEAGVELAPSADWLEAEQAWVETARGYADATDELKAGFSDRRSDTQRGMATYTEEARRKFAEATGIEADKVTDEMLAAAGVAEEPAVEPPKKDEGERELEDDLRRELGEVKDEVKAAKEEARVERRTAFVERALREGRITPGQRDAIELMYDADPEKAKTYVAELPVNDDLAREYGSDESESEETDEQRAERENREYASDASVRLGIPVEELI